MNQALTIIGSGLASAALGMLIGCAGFEILAHRLAPGPGAFISAGWWVVSGAVLAVGALLATIGHVLSRRIEDADDDA